MEAASWYQETEEFLNSFVALDPITLSVKKLKEILDNRGISYASVVEKQELIELIESSGLFINNFLFSYFLNYNYNFYGLCNLSSLLSMYE